MFIYRLRLGGDQPALLDAPRAAAPRTHAPLPSAQGACGSKLLMRSKTDPRVSRWQCTAQGQTKAFHGPAGRALMGELERTGETHLTRARAAHPEVQALVDHGLVTMHVNPAHFNYEFNARLTPAGKRWLREQASHAERQASRNQAPLFKAIRLDEPRARPEEPDHPFAGSLVYQGVQLDIETAKGEYRRGVDKEGNPWATRMPAHYGEVRGTVGADGDAVDVFVGDDPYAPYVYVVQAKLPGKSSFDETKTFLAFGSKAEAISAFRLAYTKPGFLLGCVRWPFAAWAEAMKRPHLARGQLRTPLTKGKVRAYVRASGTKVAEHERGSGKRDDGPVPPDLAGHLDRLHQTVHDAPRGDGRYAVARDMLHRARMHVADGNHRRARHAVDVAHDHLLHHGANLAGDGPQPTPSKRPRMDVESLKAHRREEA